MAGEPQGTESVFLPAPIDGIDAISSPTELPLTTARQLDNYYCFDWGIRQRVGGVLQTDFGGPPPWTVSHIIPFIRKDSGSSGNEAMLACAQRKVFRFDAVTTTSPSDVTGSYVLTTNVLDSCVFNDRIFLFNGTDAPGVITLNPLAAAAPAGFTGPTNTGLLQEPVSFHHRLYMAEKNTSKLWYGAVDAVTGVLASFDLATVFQQGGTISVLTSFSTNQGIGSEEFLVIVSNVGEVLIYSGDFPAPTNWQLIGRTNIPRPLGPRAHIRVAQDVYVYTMRGIIALSRVFASQTDDRYYTVSNKLGPSMYGFDPDRCPVRPGYNANYPFLYFLGDGGQALYVLNYERGAWSRFTYTGGIIANRLIFITSVAVAFGSLWIGTGNSENKLYRFDDFSPTASADTPTQFIWKTPYMGFGTGYEKTSRLVRILARDVSSNTSAVIYNEVSIAPDFRNTDPAGLYKPFIGLDSATTPKPVHLATHEGDPADWVVQELNPAGVGRNLSFIFVGSGTTNGQNEIAGAEVTISTGGVY